MSDLNMLALEGRLTADATKENYGEDKVRVDISFCSNSYRNNVDYPNFFNISIFGKSAENLYPYLKKGQSISIEASIKQDRWETDGVKKSKVGIEVHKIHLTGGKKTAGKEGSESDEIPSPEENIEVEVSDDELPEGTSVF